MRPTKEEQRFLMTGRRAIDALDARLCSLLVRRVELARRIQRRKAALGLPPVDEARERAVLARARARCGRRLSPAGVAAIWEVLFAAARGTRRPRRGAAVRT